VGFGVGAILGFAEGAEDGLLVGLAEGNKEGLLVGGGTLPAQVVTTPAHHKNKY